MTKYHAKKTIINGITFDSKKEGERYLLLLDMQNKKEISNLQRQVKFELQESYKYKGKTIRKIEYICDFMYTQNGKEIIEDVKSKFTAKDKVYCLKKKLLLHKYPNIEFIEVI